MINYDLVKDAFKAFKGNSPFDHCVVDGFLSEDVANRLDSEFLNYEDPSWFFYKNLIENKKALNDWNKFPALTYSVLALMNSGEFRELLSSFVGTTLEQDPGLHGGGWHMHGTGGNLNPHVDYSIHPKLGLQRKINIIVYLSKDLKPEHGGYLGLWDHDAGSNRPKNLISEVEPRFNRAIIFDTTQNSWHGMSRPLVQPKGIYRKSLAVYYLCTPPEGTDTRGRALFAPRADQAGDSEVERIIQLRSDVKTSSSVYNSEDSNG